MTRDIAIRLRGVTKRWGNHQVINTMDLDIERGQLVALLGPSGCGKSTTLRLIAGLETADTGSVEINCRDVTGAAPSERSLSMVFQSYALFPHLSVAENISFGMKVRRVPSREREQRLRQALAMTNLEEVAKRKPSELSGGQRQRVALARAIVSGHSICLMDEPLSNLDAKLRHSMRQEIRSLQQRLGMTVVYVTHDQTEAMGMADKIVLMNASCIAQIGTPAALYEHPVSAFTATFIGSPPMMLFSAEHVPPSLRPETEDRRAAGDYLVGIRPEKFCISEPNSCAMRGTVTGLEFQGAESFIYVTLHGGNPVIIRTADQRNLQIGQEIGLSWKHASAHLFDTTSGHRLHAASQASTRNAFPPTANIG
ncbi:MAG: ABC transporter ATP-binding protein [Glaciimonas sp.]|nr:ABC transporter ATP-binding protein [Glaciimonas sp.]